MSFRLIVGLGNPGSEYANTRHNVGFRVVDAFSTKHGADDWKKDRKLKGEILTVQNGPFKGLVLVKPTTFMNESGICVQKVSSYFKIPPECIVVIFDEINLAVGEVKLSLSGSAGGHNGINSILSLLPPRFARIRVGIGAKPSREIPLAEYVLGKFSNDDESVVQAKMETYLESVELLLTKGPDLAMNQINRKRKNDDSNSI